MKAVEWIKKFEGTTEADVETAKPMFLEEYGKETAELVGNRTAFSKYDSRLGAGEGAVREQRQKYQKIRATLAWLTDDDFENMVSQSCTDYCSWVAAAKKRAEDAAKAKEKAEQEAKNNAGRKFEGKKKDNRNRHHGKPHHGKPNNGKQGDKGRPQHPQKIGEVPPELR